MPVVGYDHVAIPTADSERFIEFYKRIGFNILSEQEWREGKSPIFKVQLGPNNIINVHPAGLIASLRGDAAIPGCGDLCFVWEGTMDEVLDILKRAEAPVIGGPSPRTGGRAAGVATSQSCYIRDPDGNLLEFMVYDR